MILTQTNKQTTTKKKRKRSRLVVSRKRQHPRVHARTCFVLFERSRRSKKCRGVVIINCPFPEKNELPKQQQKKRACFRTRERQNNELRTLHAREKIVSSAIIMFLLDKTNLRRKQTRAYTCYEVKLRLIVVKNQTCNQNKDIFFCF